MARTFITDEDMAMMQEAVSIQMMNDLADSKWEFEKKSRREHMFTMESKKWSSRIVDRLKKSGRHLFPTEKKTLRLTEVGCKYFACPTMIHITPLGLVDVNKVELAHLVRADMPGVSDHCYDKYRSRLIERQNPKLESPYDALSHLHWRKMMDGRMGCARDFEMFRNWAMFPSMRDEGYVHGVTDVPPLVLHNDNQFDMTEAYCKFKGVSYKPSENGEHNDDCYISRGQAVSEAIFGYWPRNLYR